MCVQLVRQRSFTFLRCEVCQSVGQSSQEKMRGSSSTAMRNCRSSIFSAILLGVPSLSIVMSFARLNMQVGTQKGNNSARTFYLSLLKKNYHSNDKTNRLEVETSAAGVLPLLKD